MPQAKWWNAKVKVSGTRINRVLMDSLKCPLLIDSIQSAQRIGEICNNSTRKKTIYGEREEKHWFPPDFCVCLWIFAPFSLLVLHSIDALWLFPLLIGECFTFFFYFVSMNLLCRPSLWLRALTHPCLWTRSITHSKSFEHQSRCSCVCQNESRR